METIIKEPKISTLTIEVSVIKIGNNKMTLSVFDQLYNEICYDEYFKIKYPIWGKVKRKESVDVVFQKNNELKKMTIPDKNLIYSFDQSMEYSLDVVMGFNNYRRGYYLTKTREFYNDKKEYINAIKSKCWAENRELALQLSNSQLLNKYCFTQSLQKFELDLILDEFNYILDGAKKFNKMIDQLENSIQLFIAV